MQQFRNVLVGVDLASGERLASEDLGAPTKEAIRRGIWVARNLGGTITFFAALDVAPHTQEMLAEGYGDASRSIEASARTALSHLVEQSAAEGVSGRAIVVFGKPWEEITRQVIRDRHDLVLVGTRNRGAAARMIFGSTSGKLVRYCPCPVWVTRPDPRYEDVNMLVACDLGPETPHLLRVAVGGGRLLDAKVHLLHALELTSDQSLFGDVVHGEVYGEFRKRLAERAEKKLRDFLAQSDHRTLPYGLQTHIVEGDPDDVIVKAIAQHGIDLLVIGTKARTGIPGVFIGNTAERLLSQVECSVLVLKPDGFVSPVTLDD